MIVDLFRRHHLEFDKEVHCIAEMESGNQSTRADIIVLDGLIKVLYEIQQSDREKIIQTRTKK